MPAKRKFVAIGKNRSRITFNFVEYGWAYGENQFKKLIWLRMKEKHPYLKIYLEFEVYDITDLTDEQVKKLLLKELVSEPTA